jgi:hypothetical protein
MRPFFTFCEVKHCIAETSVGRIWIYCGKPIVFGGLHPERSEGSGDIKMSGILQDFLLLPDASLRST